MKPIHIVTIVSMFTLTACAPSSEFMAQHGLPGGIIKERSQVDGTRYIEVHPGWMAKIGEQVGLFGSSRVKIGAIRFNDGPIYLTARVEDIVTMKRLAINIDGEVFSYPNTNSTEINLQSEGYDLTHSITRFEVPDDIVRAMVSYETKKVYIKLSTSKGYSEADFGTGCESTYPDRACVGIRNFLMVIDDVDSSQN